MSPRRLPDQPLLPSLSGPSTRRSTMAWAASTAVAALLVSGIAALAMSVQPTGASSGETAMPLIITMPPAPALEAISEPAPEASAEAPEEQAEAPQPEEPVTPPELTEAPVPPEEILQPEQPVAEKMPEIEPPPPAPVAEAVVNIPDVRPKARPERKPEPKKAEKKDKPREEPKKKTAETKREKSQASAAPASNASAATKAESGGKSAGQGKKAAASYGADVLKKINKTKRKRAPARGVAVVSFSVGSSGALASASIAKSSGNAELDQVAVDHIRRASPFPAPPEGAQRKFSFEFVGK